MKTAQFARKGLLILSTLVLMAGCGGGGGGTTGGDDTGGQPTDQAAAEFTLTAFDRTGTGQGQALNGLNRIAMMLGGSSLTRVNGTILSVNQSGGETREFHYALDIDPSSFSIPTDVQLPLEPGTYNFFFLMSGPNNKQYAGVTTDWVILDTGEGQGAAKKSRNVVSFLVHPVIGDVIPNVDVLRQLAEFHFGFNNLPISQWADPEFGISVDGSAEYHYSINTATGFSEAFVYLPQGTYTFEIRFYDGGVLKVVPIVIDVTITDDGGSINVDVVPLQIVNNVTPTPQQETNLNLVIPGGAIDQVGGAGAVEALFSMRDSQGHLIQQVLTLVPVGGNYEATVLAPALLPGPVTWSVQFRNVTANPDQLYAYCAESTTLASGAQTLLCDLRLLESVPAGYLLVNVTSNGQPVGGATVSANGETIGITSDGTGSLPAGQLEVFLPVGSYTITVTKPGYQSVAPLTADIVQEGTATTDFLLVPEDQTPPVVTIEQPEGDTNNPEPLLVYSVDDSSAVVTVFVDGEEVETTSGQTLDRLADGEHEVVVEARDGSGNVGSDSVAFMVDSTAPGISITSPANGSILNDSTPMLTFRSGESGTADVSLDDGASGAFSTPVTGGIVFSDEVGPLGDGGHRIDVVVQDGMGNESSAFTEFMIDTRAPQVQIESPVGDTTDHEPMLEYTTDESGVASAFVDDQAVPTQDGERLPRLSDGEHTITVQVKDMAGNVGSDEVVVNVQSPPPVQSYELDAFYYRHPTRRQDAYVQLDQPLSIRIPDHEAIQVIAGNAERYLLYLRLGNVHCLYLGGSYNAAIGGVELDDLEWFRRFKSPVCGLGRLHAGDAVNVEGSIRARILFGDPKFEETHLKLFLDILGAGQHTTGSGHHWDGDDDHHEGDDDHDDD
jgi:hypothetical protein